MPPLKINAIDTFKEPLYYIFMIGFLLKKNFYDSWDNLFRIVAVNIGFLAITAIPVFLPDLLGRLFNLQIVELVFSAFGIFCCCIYLSMASHCLKRISDYDRFGFAEFFKSFKTAWPAGVVMGVFVFVIFLIVTVVIPFYFTMVSPIGLVIAALVFWLTVFAFLSFQFFFSVCVRLGTDLRKALKKCMIISLDNSGFAVFTLLYNIVSLALSVVLAFLFPGPAGIILFLDQGMRLRLLKYDYLEANPGADRKKIPWDVLLIEEREKTGTRSFRNLVFPWKD